MASQKVPVVPIQDFNQGGLADSQWSGNRNSLHKLTGWDVHSVPGLLKVAQKLTEISGGVVDEFCEVSLVSTNGYVYHFSAESGKIWQQSPDDEFELVFTATALEGGVNILGAAEYQNTIYYATEDYLHKINVVNAIGAASWTTNVTQNWGKFTNGDPDFHPMLEQNLVLYIGDGSLLAQVDTSTATPFSPEALDIKPPLRIKSLGKVVTDILLGTFVADYVTKTQLLRWNGWSDSFQVSNEVNEVGINAFLLGDNIIFVQAGLQGRIYYYNSQLNTLEGFKSIPGNYSPTAYGTVHPNAVANLNNIVLAGFSNGSGNPADQGVYQIGRYSRSYPYILDLPYPISAREENGDFALTDIEIGSIVIRGFDVYFTWKRGEERGIDKIDYTEKLDGAYFETRVMQSPNRLQLANYVSMYMAYSRLPEDTDIEMYVNPNYSEYNPVDDRRNDEQRHIMLCENLGIEATTMQVKVIARTDGNSAPEIESGALVLR